MFIWDWVSIAFGWLVFLLLIFIIMAVISGIIKGVKKGTEKWKNGKKDLKRILRIERTIPEVRYDDWEIRKRATRV
ncbi:Uncharacterised protein [Streptococcus pneumoniae]|nr:Uncharacterised protein [Streptococcus pneumoniae]